MDFNYQEFLKSPNFIALLVLLCVLCFSFAIFFMIRQRIKDINSGIKFEKSEDTRLMLDRYPLLRLISKTLTPFFDEVAPRFEDDLYAKFKLAGRPGSIGGTATPRDVFDTFGSIAIAGIFAGFFVTLTMGLNLAGVVALSIAIGVLTYFVMSAWLDGEASKRQTKIDNEFPFYLDLSVMALGAGAKVEDTFDLYTADRTPTPLSEELNLVSGELKASVPFIDAMLNFNGRTQAFSVERTVTEIVNSREAGTPVAQVMNIAAKDLREARTNNAEQMGEKLKSKIILPSMMMAGSAMLLILGPAFIEILNSDVL
jgi:Flp pilus assembly protein TadB